MTKLAKGMAAPDFEVQTDTGETFRLSDHRGKSVLLFFYPQANTPACDDQNVAFSASLPTFTAKGIVVAGISPDSASTLAKLRETLGLGHILLSDPDHVAINAFGVWGEKLNYGKTYMGLIRSTFLVDPDGKLAQVWPNIRAKGHVERVIKALG